MITRPVLKYNGGKFLLAPWILEYFPEHDTYVDGFGGAANVLLQKPRTRVEYYFDLDQEVTNFMQTLGNRNTEKEESELKRYNEMNSTNYNSQSFFCDCYDNKIDSSTLGGRFVCLRQTYSFAQSIQDDEILDSDPQPSLFDYDNSIPF